METRWGKRFGRYEIMAEIGRGAMGVVYKARDPKIDRFVAVKTISLSGQNPEDECEYRDRFFPEAQAAGRLLRPASSPSSTQEGIDTALEGRPIPRRVLELLRIPHWTHGLNIVSRR